MARTSRIGIVHGSLAAFALALVGRAAHVQLWQGAAWAEQAERQHYAAASVPAPRGEIVDATGETLVASRDMVRLRVAPREVRDRRLLARALARARVSEVWRRRAVDPRRKWVELPGYFPPADVARLAAMRGVYAQPVAERVSAPGGGAQRLIGHVRAGQMAVDGLELALDSVIRGDSGTSTVLRDAHGASYESPTAPGRAARPGSTVVLTINAALQGICDEALAHAVARMGASGGDIVVMDPNDGAVLAMSSRRPDPRSTASTALTEPFEPGSTIKPFIAAALLARGRARPDEMVDTHNGTFTLNGRTITDSHAAERMTLTEVIANSSNIGIVQFAERLSPAEEYQALRDAGFGMPTGVPYPVEAAGTLREPKRWSTQSAASLAMGYEVAVTPLQLAAAYASVANGGELLAPALVREVRAADGTPRYKHVRRVVRRVMPADVARTVRGMLVRTVANGTAVEADMATFTVAGKTGTARRTVGRWYAENQYTATFVGLFPAERPQFVVLVKLDDPQGAYYGGKTAAPVSRAVLEAALAARDAALNREQLLAQEKPRGVASDAPVGDSAPGTIPTVASALTVIDTLTLDTLAAPQPHDTTIVVNLALKLAAVKAAPPAPRPVPPVDGLSLRGAVRALHSAGFRVVLAKGEPGTTWPVQGTLLRAGTSVRLYR